uniref:Uncharacterized protein n=1 Tax=Megaselia scalaris TaxID=36166 RepID=T1GVD3_MEGSC
MEDLMMYDAWTQTDAPFCQQYDPISSSYASPTELKLMEMMEALQEQLSIQTSYIQSLQQNVNAVQRSTTTSSPTTTATTEPSNYRIITDGVLEPVEIEEINRELMQQLHKINHKRKPKYIQVKQRPMT